MMRVLFCATFLVVGGCHLNRFGLAASAGDGGLDSSVPTEDAEVADASIDAGPWLDAEIDSSVDSGRDSGFDSGIDSGTDSGMLDAGSPDPCESYSGLCIRFTDTVDPDPIRSYWFTYVTAALTTVETWRAFTCVGGLVRSGSVTYCLVPDAERETGRTMFFYPSYQVDGTDTACNPSGCPRADMEVWFSGRAFAPSEITQDRGWTRPPSPPCGSMYVFVINAP